MHLTVPKCLSSPCVYRPKHVNCNIWKQRFYTNSEIFFIKTNIVTVSCVVTFPVFSSAIELLSSLSRFTSSSTQGRHPSSRLGGPNAEGVGAEPLVGVWERS